ncbi:MAG: hypothetical protein PF572_06220 [Patescibacteria group bacterium]|jgi:hypothetical protein|nr:hypothetical protein [Patescibacteria group bacterium]
MVSNNFFLFSLKIVTELVGDVIFFPLWWYTRGLVNIFQNQLEFLRNREKGLALSVWIKNIFKPMFGQSDWQGVLISIIMRIFQIIVRSIAMVFWLLLSFFIIVLWVTLPVLIFYQIIFQLFNFL